MKKIPLSGLHGKGLFAIVDDGDYEKVAGHRWHARKKIGVRAIYASTCLSHADRRAIWMHRLILGLPHGRTPVVDHINGDGLDNRRSNLRVCDQVINGLNRHKKKDGATSQYIGVSFKKETNSWVAKIRIRGCQYSLGYFSTEYEAYVARDRAVQNFMKRGTLPQTGRTKCSTSSTV